MSAAAAVVQVGVGGCGCRPGCLSVDGVPDSPIEKGSRAEERVSVSGETRKTKFFCENERAIGLLIDKHVLCPSTPPTSALLASLGLLYALNYMNSLAGRPVFTLGHLAVDFLN